MYNECFKREKLLHYRIKGQKRPFIDEDLQLQLPGLESSLENPNLGSYSQVYSYYSTYFPSRLDFPKMVQQVELEHGISQAQQAYDKWKNIQQQLHTMFQQFRDS